MKHVWISLLFGSILCTLGGSVPLSLAELPQGSTLKGAEDFAPPQGNPYGLPTPEEKQAHLQQRLAELERQPEVLDEGCLPVTNLIVKLAANSTNRIVIFDAPQPGNYLIYRNFDPAAQGAPPGNGWQLWANLPINAPNPIGIGDDSPIAPYCRYIVVHECPVAPNDNCASAAVLPPNTWTSFSTIGANHDGPGNWSLNCFGFTNDIWFLVSGQCNGTSSVILCGSNYDTQIEVYQGSGCPNDATTAIACNDDHCDYSSAVTFPTTLGLTYLIRVGGWNGDTGTGRIYYKGGAANDSCQYATEIYPQYYPNHDFDTRCSNTDGAANALCQAGDGQQIQRDVWFRWYNDSYCRPTSFGLCASGYDTKLAVYSGTGCGALTMLACNDDECGTRSLLTITPEIGETYWIRIGGYNGAMGAGTLNITQAAGPANDRCTAPVTVSTGTTAFSTAGACTEGDLDYPDSDCNIQSDVWFEYTAPGCGYAVVTTCNSSFDTKLAAYADTACSYTVDHPLACNDDSSACANHLNAAIRFNTEAGRTYLIRLGGYNGATGSGNLNIDQIYQFVNADNCGNATQPIPVGTYPLDNRCTSTDGLATDACGQIYNDLWFLFSPAVNTSYTATLCGSAIDTKIAVYSTFLVTCASLAQPFACSDNVCGDDAQVTFSGGPIILGPYLIRVGSATQAEEGSMTLTISQN